MGWLIYGGAASKDNEEYEGCFEDAEIIVAAGGLPKPPIASEANRQKPGTSCAGVGGVSWLCSSAPAMHKIEAVCTRLELPVRTQKVRSRVVKML
eukprot:161207-Amphidinium_carterae.1